MATQTTDLFAAALGLPLNERAALVEVLIDSLPAEQQAKIDTAWRKEVARRVAALDRGEVETIPAEQVFAKYDRDPS